MHEIELDIFFIIFYLFSIKYLPLFSRSLLQQAGPLLAQLSQTRQKYEEEE